MNNMCDSKPLLSVIVPVYNVEPYLKKCLISIMKQTYKEMEIICVNDGSTDGSREILLEMMARDSRIRIIDQENKGLISARKRGIEDARGDLVAYVDSDDWIDSNMYKKMIALLIENDADLVTSGCYREYENKTSTEMEAIAPGVYEGDKLRCDFWSNMIGHKTFYEQNIKVTLWSKVYKKEVLYDYQIGINEAIRIGEDIAVVFPVLLNAQKVVVSGCCFYHYRIRQNSMTRLGGAKEKESISLLEKHLRKEFKKTADYPYKELQLLAIILFSRMVAIPETVVCYKDGSLFPYVSVKETDKLIVYGTGRYGKKLYMHLKNLGSNIVGVCDRNVEDGIIPIEKLQDYEYDKVIIGVLNRVLVDQIVDELITNKVPQNKIAVIDMSELQSYETRRNPN